ncbi:hypothetical protein ACFLWA_07140 [Chloroflexota bacterium]
MKGYELHSWRGEATEPDVDELGNIVSGTTSYWHTAEACGNSDIGVVTVAGGRVVDVRLLPD